MEDIVEGFDCKECGSGVFYFFSINKQLHFLCRNCGKIVNLTDLQKDLKEEEKQLKRGKKE